ncbi:MAG: hypothetical protein JXQ80_09995 [Bacteroidales bacterium]|nr:hypothetical protein [Bacteroidales bacterium]
MQRTCFTILLSGLLITLASGQQYSWETALKAKLESAADSLTTHLLPWTIPVRAYKVEDFGAKGDGVTINTREIQEAVDVCSAAGGGIVSFSSGSYVTGTFQIRSGVMIEVAKGCRILGSTNLADYPEKVEQFKSVMSENHKYRQSLIYAEGAKNIGISGAGEIYFRGEKANFPGKQTTGEIIGRPFGIRMIECTNIVMQDITLRNAAAWMQSYIYCNNMIFDGIKVINHANFNNDGLDVDGCDGVIIRNCLINSEDDAMCLKGCSDKPTQHILVENSFFVSTCNALKIGTDTQGNFKNIVARNLLLGGIPASMASSAGRQASTGITLATVDGGNIEDVYIHDVIIHQARCPVFIRIGNRLRVMHGLPKPPVGILNRILIENVTGKGNFRQGSYIAGIPGHNVENVIIRNYQIEMEGGGTAAMAEASVPENEGGYPDAHQFLVQGLPAYGFYLQHAANIWLDMVRIVTVTPDCRPEFAVGNDIHNVVVNGIDITKQDL